MKQAQFEDVQRLAVLGCWEWDVAANRVTWTEGLYRIYGLDPDTFPATYEGYLERVHPDDRERVAATVGTAYASGSTFDFEERIVRPDGEVRWLRSRGHVERDGSGQALRLLGVCHDVTDLHLAQERAVRLAGEEAARQAAEAAAARLQFLADASAMLASSLDYEETLRNVARMAVPRITDWCAVDLLEEDGSLRRVAVEHPDPARVRLAYRLQEEYPSPRDDSRGVWRVLTTGEAELGEEIPESLLVAAAQDEEHLRIIRGLGLRSYIIAPLRGHGRVLGAMTFVQAESERRFSRSDLPLLEDLARRGGVAIENARLVDALKAAQQQMAEQNEKLLMQRDQLEQQATELEIQAEELQQALHELEQQSEELEQTLHELEQRNRELAQQQELAEHARQAAEAANRAKSDFLATMSHELRTPLNAIGGYSELMQLGLHGAVTPQQVETLDRIRRNQRRLLSLITDILNFTRIDAGRLTVEPGPVAAAAMLTELEAVTAPQAAARQQVLEFGPAGAVEVWADRERAEQVLLNLLTNAIKFTPAGGRIRVECTANEEQVTFTVADTGRGIPAEKLESIFDPFVQVDPQLTREVEGIGLGLSISRELARAMGGDITAASEPGQGSVFTLILPRAAGAPAYRSGSSETLT